MLSRYPNVCHAIAVLFLLLLPLSSNARRLRKDYDPNARKFMVVNLSLSVVEVYWMNLVTEHRVLQFELFVQVPRTN
jgi:hypothetical protein